LSTHEPTLAPDQDPFFVFDFTTVAGPGDGQRFTYAAGYYYDPAVGAFEVYAAEARLHDGATSRVDRWL